MSAADPVRRRAARVPAARRRVELLQAAREEFVAHGYDGAGAREIARRAGTRVNVLYRLFGSKDELFHESVLRPLLDWVAELSTTTSFDVENAAGERERHQALLTICTGLLEAMIEVAPLLGVALYGSSERGRAFYADHFYPLLEDSFAQAARAMGTGWSAAEFDPKFLILTAVGTFHAYAMDRHFRQEPVDVERTARLYVRLLMSGAMATPA